MNKQELIEKYKSSLNKVHKVYGDYYKTEAYEEVLKDLKQLDEPQKVTVPQFVADYIKYAIENDWDFQDLFKCIEDEEDEELTRWVYHERNQETLAAAWINGYEVEKEKRYRVKLKSNPEEVDYLVDTKRNGLRFYSNIYTQSREHTRKEIEAAGFGWVFDCPGIEIEEVE